MKGSIIEEVDSYRYLGTILDNKVNGDPQYSKLIHTNVKHMSHQTIQFGYLEM